MKCPRCQADNPTTDRFCGQCGAPLAAHCPQCGTSVVAGNRFCGQCGASVQVVPTAAPAPPATAPPPTASARERRPDAYTPRHLAEKILRSRSVLEGERRPVTVLFADLAGFTRLAEKLDPEDVHEIIDRCFELITAEVHRLEGTINQYTGDGVMALFGAPIAHEDGPRRAVHAALGIQRALRDYGREVQAARGFPLQMRIGLNTGPVVVGRIGDDLRMDYTAVGDTTNLAARMQQLARPGSVLASEATWKSVAGFFEGLDLGEVEVKGHAPARAFEVLRARGQRSRLEVAAERGLTPLVGREREVAALMDLFREARTGRGQVALVTGDAGIGKSRLLLELRRRLAEAEEPVTWLEGQCVSFGQSIPFLPVIDQLRRNFAIEEMDGEPEIIAKIEHGMRRMGGLEPHIPHLRYLLSVDPGDPAVVAMEALTRRRKILEAVRALSLRGAQLRPIVFVFEDLHWVDSSTEEYLTSLVDSMASAPIMVIGTYRLGYTPPFAGRSFATTLTLRALSEAEALTMAGRVLGSEQFPAELRAALMEKAEGVPLFVEEVTKTLLDLGVLRRDNGGFRMVRAMAEVSVPETIQGIILARLDRLGEDGKRTVQLASVIGRQFLRRLLERIAGLSDQMEGLLGELKALEIIYEQGLLPEPAYIFKHAVIQDVAYQSLLLQRRRSLHQAVGEAIEDLYADRLADHYEELAHHFSHGEDWTRALEYLVLSADRARDAYANQTALDFYARALEAAGRATPAIAPSRVMEVLRRRARLLSVLARFPEAVSDLERMMEMARGTGDRRGEGQAAAELGTVHYATLSAEHVPEARRMAELAGTIAAETGDQHVLARSLYLLGAICEIEGELAEGDTKLTESLRISEAHGFKDVAAGDLTLLGIHANWRGEFRRALTITAEARRVSGEVHDVFHEGLSLAVRCLAHIGLGEYAQGMILIREGLALARERDLPFNIGRLTNSLGWAHQELGDFARAAEYDREGADLGARHKIANVEISSLINLGIDHVSLGEPGRAIELLEGLSARVEHAFGAHRWRWGLRLVVPLADALIARGQAERALPHLERGLARAAANGCQKYVGLIRALTGRVALEARDWSRAEANLAEALRIGRELAYPTLTWQAAHQLARALAGQDRREEAFAAIQTAAETIDRVGDAAPDPALRASFLAWPKVIAAREDFDRLQRA